MVVFKPGYLQGIGLDIGMVEQLRRLIKLYFCCGKQKDI